MEEKWCVTDNKCTDISELYDTVDELFNNILGTYTAEEMKENGFTICKYFVKETLGRTFRRTSTS